MALTPSSRYPAQVDTGDAGYPHGKARSSGSYQDGTGTPLNKDWLNDLWGFQQALLDAAGATPSGDPDEVGASQYLTALIDVARAQTLGRHMLTAIQLRTLDLGGATPATDAFMGAASTFNDRRTLLVKGGTNGVFRVGDTPIVELSGGTVNASGDVRKVVPNGAGGYLAVGDIGSNRNYRSTNSGSTWTAGGAFGGGFGIPSDAVWEGSHYVVRSGGATRRSNTGGISWVIPAGDDVGTIIGTSPDGGLAVLIAGTVLALSGTDVAKTTNDGDSWTAAASVPSTLDDPQSRIVGNGGYIGLGGEAYVFVKQGGFDPGDVVEVWVTTDAATWTKRAEIPGFGAEVFTSFRAYMCLDTGLLAVAASSGVGTYLAASGDRGRSWTPLVTYDGGIMPNAIALANGRIFAAGNAQIFATDRLL